LGSKHEIVRGVNPELILHFVQDEILRGVYPKPESEILRFTQDDRKAKGSG
jgi:hypothetical protein